jgi:glycine cleavage system H protein
MAKVKEFLLPDDLYYDRKEHIWARPEHGGARVGLDAFGACAAGTVAYIKLLPPGRQVRKGRPFGSMEAGKYVGPLRAPIGGTVAETNQEVLGNPKMVNLDHYEEGWFVLIVPANLDEDLADLVHGAEVQPWLEDEVRDYEETGKLKKEEERECV